MTGHILLVQPDGFLMGGVQVRSIMVTRSLNNAGYRVSWLVPGKGSSVVEGRARAQGFDVYRWAGVYRPRRIRSWRSFRSNLAWCLGFPLAVWRVRRLIKGRNVDVVHTNGLLNLVPLVAARLARRRTVIHLIGDHYPSWLVAMLRPIIRLCADRIVFVGERMTDYYGFPRKGRCIRLIREPIDPDAIHMPRNTDDKQRARMRLLQQCRRPQHWYPDDGLLIGAVGHLVPAKNWLLCLDLIEDLMKRYHHLRFMLFGAESPTQRPYAQQIAHRMTSMSCADRVALITDCSDVASLIAGIDLLLMTSREEGTPIAILEAMAAGVPVIATDVGAVREQVQHGQTGFIAASGDAEALRRHLITLIDDASMRHSFSQAARPSLRRAGYDLATCVDGHDKLYRELLDT